MKSTDEELLVFTKMAGVIPPLLLGDKSKQTADVIRPRNLDPAGFPAFSGKELTEAKKTARQHLLMFVKCERSIFVLQRKSLLH